MNKRVDIPELQLDGSTDVVVADDLGKVLDDLQTPLEIAPMVVRHLEDEEFVEYVAIDSQGFASRELSTHCIRVPEAVRYQPDHDDKLSI